MRKVVLGDSRIIIWLFQVSCIECGRFNTSYVRYKLDGAEDAYFAQVYLDSCSWPVVDL